ncbi:methionine--tRNA ligase, partial [Thermococci archaeon]
DHPNADKLYLVKVDLGDEVRQLVAGLKKYYKPEELLNHYVIVVTNLEPKKLRGVESQGMLLAADDGENVSLLLPDREIKLGARIR